MMMLAAVNASAQSVWRYKTRSITVTENGKSNTAVFRIGDTPSIAQRTQVDCPQNLDFELGNFTNWQCYTGTAATSGTGASQTNVVSNIVNTTPQNNRHTIISSATTPAIDPYGGFPVLCPNGSGNSIKLGNSGSGSQAERVRYTFTVPATATDFNLLYNYAVVFQNPQVNHTSAQQPRFQAKVYDAVTLDGISCANYDFIATAGLPGFAVSNCTTCNPASNSSNPVLYKSWTGVTINLSGFAGRTMILEFTTEDCTIGGHFGYAYVDVNSGCSGLVSGAAYCPGSTSVTLNAPPGYQAYNWYNANYTQLLGTGSSITLTPPPPVNSIINIDLVPFPGFGCRDTVYTTVTVSPKPVASFSVSPNPVCVGTSPVFVNTSTPGTGTNTYVWKFGDNTQSTQATPVHPYTSGGPYDIKLIATNSNGCKDSTTQPIEVKAKPVVTFDILSPQQQCISGNSFQFQNTSQMSATTTHTWHLGDGNTSSQQNLTHSYAAPGNYTVKLLADNLSVANCKDSLLKNVIVDPSPTVAIALYNGSRQCLRGNNFRFKNNTTSNLQLTYEWRFGDGTISTLFEPQHSYVAPGNYKVKLIASAAGGCKDSTTIDVIVDENPAAAFVVTSNTAQCQDNNQFTFQNNSAVAGGGVLTYLWLYGDGNTSTQNAAPYTYSVYGPRTIQLIATTVNGCKDTVSNNVTIHPKPIAAINMGTPAEQCYRGNAFTYQDNTAIPTGNYTRQWMFNSGVISVAPSLDMIYPAAGTYTVTLVATSDQGCINTADKTVTVHPNPVAGFSINDTTQCLRNNSFVFTNTSSPAGLTYEWDFGDGTTSVQNSPVKNYTVYDASRLVRLIAATDKSCKDTLYKTVYLYQHPAAAFTITSPAEQCLKGNAFSFNNSSVFGSALTYQWSFGDGNTASSTNGSNNYTSAGNYSVKLIATTVENGCTDEVSQPVKVYQNPGAAFTVNATPQCLQNNSFGFDANHSGYQYQWSFGDGNTAAVKTIAHSYAVPNSYTVQLIVNNQASASLTCADTSSQVVVVHPMPVGFIANAGTYNLCQGEVKTLTATGGNSYQWLLNGVPINGAVAATYNASLEGVYTVNVTNQFGCTTLSNDVVRINEIKKPSANFTWDSYCINQQVRFTNTTIPGAQNTVNYAWNFGDGSPAVTIKDPQHTFTNKGAFTVKLTVTSAICPAHLEVMEKTLNIETPISGKRYPSINAVVGNTYLLAARANGVKYQWLPVTGLSNPNLRTPVLTATGEQDYKVVLTMSSGCQVTDSIRILIFSKSEVLVPKAFTPNRDGLNDVLYPILVGIRQLKYFRVYNRWGNLVFSTTNALTGWDGMYRGQLQPSETYTWVAEAIDDKGNTIHNGGNTILIR